VGWVGGVGWWVGLGSTQLCGHTNFVFGMKLGCDIRLNKKVIFHTKYLWISEATSFQKSLEKFWLLLKLTNHAKILAVCSISKLAF
jgi:hypothetical protein